MAVMMIVGVAALLQLVDAAVDPAADAVLQADDLVQLDAYQQQDSYIGCYLGWFWCKRMQDAGIPASEAAKLSFGPDPQVDEWHYDGKPTCVARGVDWAACSEDDTALLCPGKRLLSSNTFGTGEAQAEAVKAAIDNGGVHPDCPGCFENRKVDKSVTTCRTLKQQSCPYQCKPGYQATGTHYCSENGTLSGGSCEPIPVNPDNGPSQTPSPTPRPAAKPVTPVDVTHENWTAYEEARVHIKTRAFQDRLKGDACYYLWQLAEYLNKAGYASPRSPLRTKLVDAARDVQCAWLQEEVRAIKPEFPQVVPVRGDHGPWPRIYRAIRLMVDGYGPVALSLDRSTATGRDVYEALKQAMSSKDEYTIYIGGDDGSSNARKPLDEGDKLSELGAKLDGKILRAVKGRQTLYSTGGVKEDGSAEPRHRPLGTDVWKGIDLHRSSIAP